MQRSVERRNSLADPCRPTAIVTDSITNDNGTRPRILHAVKKHAPMSRRQNNNTKAARISRYVYTLARVNIPQYVDILLPSPF